jgi:hypothetical protein
VACLGDADVIAYALGTPLFEIDEITRHVEHCRACQDRVVAAVRASRPEVTTRPLTSEEWLERHPERRVRPSCGRRGA